MKLVLKKMDGGYVVETPNGDRLDMAMGTTFWDAQHKWYRDYCVTQHREIALAAIEVQRRIYRLSKLINQLGTQS